MFVFIHLLDDVKQLHRPVRAVGDTICIIAIIAQNLQLSSVAKVWYSISIEINEILNKFDSFETNFELMRFNFLSITEPIFLFFDNDQITVVHKYCKL